MSFISGVFKFLLKWFILFCLIIGAIVWFLHTPYLNQYAWVENAKSYLKATTYQAWQTQKNNAIHYALVKMNYQDGGVMANHDNPTIAPSTDNISHTNNIGNTSNSNHINNNTPAIKGGNLSHPNASGDVKKITTEDTKDTPIVENDDYRSQFSHLSIPFYYDNSGAPGNLNEAFILSVLQKESDAWTEACNISFDYKGDRMSDYVDGNNTIPGTIGLVKWEELSGGAIGQAHQGNAQGPALGFVLSLSPSYFSHQQNLRYLDSTVLHEMGHVIGLGHSKNPRSIMFWQQSERLQVLNKTDKAMCAYFRARWSGLSAAKASDRFGVLVNEAATQEPDTGDDE